MHVELELTRAYEADDPFAVRTDAEETYSLRDSDGTVTTTTIAWQDKSLRADLEAIHEEDCPTEVMQRVGERLRRLLRGTSWQQTEREIVNAMDKGQLVTITIRSNAAELYTLPWELMTLQAKGQRLCELPQVMIEYEWPGTAIVPASDSDVDTPGRILMAWSDAGGFVPADEHRDALAAVCPPGYFVPERDVLPRVSWSRLDRAFAQARNDGYPITALHILCHGSRDGDATCLAWTDGDNDRRRDDVNGVRLRQLLAPYAEQVRLVVLCACDSGRHGQLDNYLGSIVLNLHRAGIETVVGSRAPFSMAGSTRFTRALYGALVTEGQAIEFAFPAARRQLVGMRTGDWTSLICYRRAPRPNDGETSGSRGTQPVPAPPRLDAALPAAGQPLGAGRGESADMDVSASTDPLGDRLRLSRRLVVLVGVVAAVALAWLAWRALRADGLGMFEQPDAAPPDATARVAAYSAQNARLLGDAPPRTEHSIIRVVPLVELGAAGSVLPPVAHPGTQLCEALQRHAQTLRAAYDVRPGEVLCGAAPSLSNAGAAFTLEQATVQAREEEIALIVLVSRDGTARMAALGTLQRWLGPDMPIVNVATEAARGTLVPILWALAQVAQGNAQAEDAGCLEVPRSSTLDAIGVLALFLSQRVDGCVRPAQSIPTGRALLAVCEQQTVSWACDLARVLYAELYPQASDAQAQLRLVFEHDEYRTFAAVALPSLILTECEEGRLLPAYRMLHQWFEGRSADPRFACQRLTLSDAVTCFRVHERAGTVLAASSGVRDELERIADHLSRDCEICEDREACTLALGRRGWRLGRAGRWAQARDDLKAAYGRSRSAAYGLLLIEAHLHLGDIDDARRLLDVLMRDNACVTAADHLNHALYAWLAARRHAASGDAVAKIDQARYASTLVDIYERCCAGDTCKLDEDDTQLRALVCGSSERSACVFELLVRPWSPSYLPELRQRLGVPESSGPSPSCADAAHAR